MNYTTGQIVRTRPLEDGSFSIYEIEGFHLDLMEVREIGFICGFETYADETEFLHPDQVELFEFECNVGKYRLGDTVRAMGLNGTFTAISFYQMRTTGEINCTIKAPDGLEYLWAAQLCKKA